jgi:hypothetical protein
MVTIPHGQRSARAVFHVDTVIRPETGLVRNLYQNMVAEIAWG